MIFASISFLLGAIWSLVKTIIFLMAASRLLGRETVASMLNWVFDLRVFTDGVSTAPPGRGATPAHSDPDLSRRVREFEAALDDLRETVSGVDMKELRQDQDRAIRLAEQAERAAEAIAGYRAEVERKIEETREGVQRQLHELRTRTLEIKCKEVAEETFITSRDEFSTGVKHLERKVLAVEASNNRLSDNVTDFMNRSQQSANTLQEALDLRGRIQEDNMRAFRADINAQMAELVQKVADAKGMVAELNTRLGGLPQRMTDAEGALQTLETSVEGLAEDLAGLEGSVEAAGGAAVAAQARADEAAQAAGAAQETADGAAVAAAAAQGMADEASAEIAALSNTVGQLGEQVAAHVAPLEDRIGKLEAAGSGFLEAQASIQGRLFPLEDRVQSLPEAVEARLQELAADVGTRLQGIEAPVQHVVEEARAAPAAPEPEEAEAPGAGDVAVVPTADVLGRLESVEAQLADLVGLPGLNVVGQLPSLINEYNGLIAHIGAADTLPGPGSLAIRMAAAEAGVAAVQGAVERLQEEEGWVRRTIEAARAQFQEETQARERLEGRVATLESQPPAEAPRPAPPGSPRHRGSVSTTPVRAPRGSGGAEGAEGGQHGGHPNPSPSHHPRNVTLVSMPGHSAEGSGPQWGDEEEEEGSTAATAGGTSSGSRTVEVFVEPEPSPAVGVRVGFSLRGVKEEGSEADHEGQPSLPEAEAEGEGDELMPPGPSTASPPHPDSDGARESSVDTVTAVHWAGVRTKSKTKSAKKAAQGRS